MAAVEKATTSAAWQTVSAVMKSRLADAIAAGDTQAIVSISSSIAAAQAATPGDSDSARPYRQNGSSPAMTQQSDFSCELLDEVGDCDCENSLQSNAAQSRVTVRSSAGPIRARFVNTSLLLLLHLATMRVPHSLPATQRPQPDVHSSTHRGVLRLSKPEDSLPKSNDSIFAVWIIVPSSCPSRHELGTGEPKCRMKNSVPGN